MGVIRKVISGTAAICTGGLSLGVLQFRSDTERSTRQTRLLREEMERQHRERMEMDAAYLEASRIALSDKGKTSMKAKDPHRESVTTQLDNIARLAILKEKGALTDEEFESEKKKLLSKLAYPDTLFEVKCQVCQAVFGVSSSGQVSTRYSTCTCGAVVGPF